MVLYVSHNYLTVQRGLLRVQRSESPSGLVTLVPVHEGAGVELGKSDLDLYSNDCPRASFRLFGSQYVLQINTAAYLEKVPQCALYYHTYKVSTCQRVSPTW
jgi:hypothetical protein